MTSLFLDTSYLIALEAADDQYHDAARSHWAEFRTQKPRLVTTSYVFDEVVTFFNTRGRHQKAVEIGLRLTQSASLRMVHVGEDLFFAGWAYLTRHGDKTYSLTDCISFVLMKQMKIRSALAFDRHFAQAGFKVVPGG